MKKKWLILCSCGLMTLACMGVSFTLAGFIGKAKVNAPIGEAGVVGTYIFLDTGTWTEEAGGAAFCVDCWTSAGVHTFQANKTQTTEDYLVFNIDLDLYNNGAFQFVRYKSDIAVSDLTWSYAKDIIYNVSEVFSISNRTITGANGKNLYRISGWGSTDFYDEANPKNRLGTIAVGSWIANYADS